MITRIDPALQILGIAAGGLVALVLVLAAGTWLVLTLVSRAVTRRVEHIDTGKCCNRTDRLCRRFGCPVDPQWKGDGVR